jgi:hypothetical protein
MPKLDLCQKLVDYQWRYMELSIAAGSLVHLWNLPQEGVIAVGQLRELMESEYDSLWADDEGAPAMIATATRRRASVQVPELSATLV